MKWTDITFLESVDNLKPRIKALTGRVPSTELAKEVTACLQQGRLYYEAAAKSSLQIRPLILFYGTMSFAKALSIALNHKNIASMPQSHGIGDISSNNSKIADLRASINKTGTFQLFNDITSRLNKVDYTNSATMRESFMAPTNTSNDMVNLEVTLKEVLSRIPGLQKLYQNTFKELSNCVSIHLNKGLSNENAWELLITSKDLFTDRQTLKKIAEELRCTFPILKNFNIGRATPAWSASYIYFSNLPIPDDEYSELNLIERDRGYQTKDTFSNDESLPFKEIEILGKSDLGSFANSENLISPVNTLYVSKLSWHYIGMYLLSSLVRYRPQIWSYAITRTAQPDGTSNDSILSLLEEFMILHEREMPEFVINTFEG